MSSDLYLLALADIGQKVLNAIVATERLGHEDLRNSTRYFHANGDLSVALVTAVIDGDPERAKDAMTAWLVGWADDMTRKYPEVAA